MAVTSAIWSGVPQCRHQSVMSFSEGNCLPYSIRLALLECQPARRARSRWVSPAAVRISRSVAPSLCLAWYSGELDNGTS
jgi:hypothetical protein